MSEISEHADDLIDDFEDATVDSYRAGAPSEYEHYLETYKALFDYIATLEAEVAALKPYRDGYDPKIDKPDEGIWVLMRDCDDNFFDVTYDPELGWYFNDNGDGTINWYESDFDFVCWYPQRPLPEVGR